MQHSLQLPAEEEKALIELCLKHLELIAAFVRLHA
jgi:hypothetical protein